MNHISNRITLIFVIAIIVSNIFWGIAYFRVKASLIKSENELRTITHNKKVTAFQKLFIDKVLLSDGVVDFDTRVDLQNTVNETKDNDIIKAWNGFLGSKNEADGQRRVKELLSLLSSRVYGE